MNKQTLHEVADTVFHFKNAFAQKLQMILGLSVFSLSYFKVIVVDNIDQILAVAVVVILDFLVGVAVAIKQNDFETRKALKVVSYLGFYWLLLGALTLMERGFNGAFWLTETIMIPILTFQIVSVLKNMSILGLITSGTLKNIFNKIDKYKDKEN